MDRVDERRAPEVDGVVEFTWKSVVFNCRFAEERVTPSAVPVIWKVEVAAGVLPLVVLTVTIDAVPGVTVGGTALQDIPAARFAQPTVIGWLNPLTAAKLAVKFCDLPLVIVCNTESASSWFSISTARFPSVRANSLLLGVVGIFNVYPVQRRYIVDAPNPSLTVVSVDL